MLKLYAAELLFVVVLLSVNDVGESLKCFVCNTKEVKNCAKNISFLQDCEPRNASQQVYCRKIYEKLIFKGEKKFSQIHECAYERGPKGCYRNKWLQVVFEEVCECDKDQCNGGSRLLPGVLPLVLPIEVIAYLTR